MMNPSRSIQFDHIGITILSSILGLLIVGVLSVDIVSAQCPGEPVAYLTDRTAGELIRVDLETGSSTVIATGLISPSGLDLNPAETTAYVAESSPGVLTAVDLASGMKTNITSMLVSPEGVVVNAAETAVWVISGTSLVSVDIAMGAQTTITSSLTAPIGLAVNASETTAYVTEQPSMAAGLLSSVDLSSGAITNINMSLGAPFGIDLNGSETSVFIMDNGDLKLIPLATGMATTIGTYGATGVDLNGHETKLFLAGGSSLDTVDLGTTVTATLSTGFGQAYDVVLASSGCPAVCPNEDHLYMSDGMGGALTIYDRKDGMVKYPPSAPLGTVSGISVNRSLSKAYVVDAGGSLTEIDLVTGSPTNITSSLSTPYDVALNAAETDAWVTEYGSGELSSVNLSTGVVTLVAGGLNSPRGFAVDSGQNFAYVAESSIGSIARVDLMSGSAMPVGMSGLTIPDGVAINAAGTDLYVTDSGAGTVEKVPIFGGMSSTIAGPFTNPSGVAVNEAETQLFVVEPTIGRLTEISLASLGRTTLSPSLAVPMGLDLASSACQRGRLSPSTQAPGTGSTIAVCLHIDMRNSPSTLGSYGVTLDWNPSILSYVTSTGGDPPWDGPVVNSTNAGMGSLTVADADATGSTGAPHVLCTEFDVLGPTGSDDVVDLEFTSIFEAGTFANLMSTALAEDVTIDVQGLCVVGDVNGDTLVNSGDALIILSNEIMLPIPGAYATLIAAGCGDADGDTMTDSVDSNVVLTSEVGLPVDPNFPFNAPLQTFESCPACNAPPAALSPPRVETSRVTSLAPDPVITSSLLVTNSKPKRGDLFEVVVSVDLGSSGLSLGSYAAHLAWESKAVEYVGMVPGPAGSFPSPLLNSAEARDGILRFAQARPQGATGSIELVRLRFLAHNAIPRVESLFDLEFSSMGSEGPGFRKILQFLVPEDSLPSEP